MYDRTIPDTYDAGYVLGVILGDGSLNVLHAPHGDIYVVKLSVTSKAFAEKFRETFGWLRQGPVWFTSLTSRKKANPLIGMPECEVTEWVAGATDRGWYERLEPFKKRREFEPILAFGKTFKRGLVDGMIDSEGYVNHTSGYTDIANKDMALLNVLAKCLDDLGFNAKVYGPYPYSRGVAHLRTRTVFTKTV